MIVLRWSGFARLWVWAVAEAAQVPEKQQQPPTGMPTVRLPSRHAGLTAAIDTGAGIDCDSRDLRFSEVGG